MPYFEVYYYEDKISCAYWQTGKHFYRRYECEPRARRISAEEYMSAYEMYRNL